MHKGFYASGFLYHPRTQQILLQQKNSADKYSEWTLLGIEGSGDKTGEEVFQKAVEKILHLKLKQSAVKPVYEYVNGESNKQIYVSYAKINKLEKFNSKNGVEYCWFSFKAISKLKVSAQTKQDITIGQRVISSSIRKKLGQQTID